MEQDQDSEPTNLRKWYLHPTQFYTAHVDYFSGLEEINYTCR